MHTTQFYRSQGAKCQNLNANNSHRIATIIIEQEETNVVVKMAENEDHRQKNIQLAKKLNEVKAILRQYRQENISLEEKYERSQIRATKSQNEKKAIFNSFLQLKHQLDEAFVQHSTEYFHLMQQVDQILSKCGPKLTIQANALNKTSMNGATHPKVEFLSSATKLNINGHNKVPVHSNSSNLQMTNDSVPQQTEFTNTFNGLAKTGKENAEAKTRRTPKAKHKRRSLRIKILKKSVQPESKKTKLERCQSQIEEF